FRYTVAWFVASILAFVIGLQWGVVGVAACYTIAVAIVEPVNTYLTARAVDFPLRRYAAALSGVVQATAIMALAVSGARVGLVHAGVPTALRLLLLIVLGAVVYVPCCAWRAPEIVAEIRRVGGRRRNSRPRVDALAAQLSEH